MRRILVFTSIVILVGACSNPKAASEENFETAINAWINENPPCIDVPDARVRAIGQTDSQAFPRYVEQADSPNPMRLQNQQRALAPFQALAEAGLMRMEQAQINVDDGPFGTGSRTQTVAAYSLTPEGERALSTRTSRIGGPTAAFCYGTPEVKEIVRFTEPADMMGATISRVEYTYQVKDRPAWTRTPALQAAFPQLVRDSAETLEGRAAVVLTNEGWVHERAAKF